MSRVLVSDLIVQLGDGMEIVLARGTPEENVPESKRARLRDIVWVDKAAFMAEEAKKA